MIIDDLGAQIASRVAAAAAGGFSLTLRNATCADMTMSFISLNADADATAPLGRACARILAMPPVEMRAVANLLADLTIAAVLEARRQEAR